MTAPVVATTDGASRRRRRWSVYPTRRFAAVVLAAGLLWMVPSVGSWLAAGAALALLGLASFDYFRLPRARDIDVVRSAPTTVGLGDPHDAEYVVRSQWPWPVAYQLLDRLPFGIEGTVAGEWRELGPDREETLAAPIVGTVRGRHVLGDVALRLRTALQLLVRIVVVPRSEDAAIVVIPSLSNVRRFRLLAVQNRLSDAGIRALKQRGEGSAFASLRDYVPGDDPRHVDWKASARHGRLISREQTIERSQTVISMIDCGRAMTQLSGRFARLEHVLSAALVLTDVASTAGDRVGLIAFDDEVRAFVAPQRGGNALRALRTALSSLDASMTEPDYAAAFRLLATSQRRRALVVLFTDVVDVRTARAFIAYASRAARRHAFVVVAIENEALLDAARPTTSGANALFRSAAAEELVREREESLARMRQAGITVLDVGATRMAAAVVNRYLEIKARGLL